ncbi:MAG: hypothetical protein ACJ72E_17330 [Marmoricola sp.]
MSSRTAELGAQIAQQRDKLTETVSALTETVGALTEKIDTHDITDALKERATTSAEELRTTAGDERGRKGLLIGAVAAFIGVVILRKLLR